MSLLIVVPIVLLALFLYHQLYARRQGLPPGPLPLPLIGNLYHIEFGRFDACLRDIGKRYGGMFTVWLGPRFPYVVITDYDILKEALVTHGDAFVNRPVEASIDYFTHGNYGVISSSGAMWREHRRFALHTLRDFGVSRNVMEAKINYDMERMIDAIRAKVAGGEVVDITYMLSVAVGSVIANLVYGQRYEFDDAEFAKLLQMVRDSIDPFRSPLVVMTEEIAWIRKLPLFGHFGMDKLIVAERLMRETFYGLLTKSLEKGKEDEEPECYVEAFKQHRNKLRDTGKDDVLELYSDWQLYNIATELWGAGMDTTVNTLTWAVGFMCANTECQSKAQAEIDTVLGTSSRVSMADRTSMPYTAACVTEAQRLANIAFFNLNREVAEDVTVRGFHLKKGTRVQGSIGAVLHDEQYFASPLAFDPERFAYGGSADKVVAFGMGRRQCLGESLARMELFILFTTLMQLFTVRFATDKDAEAFGLDKALMGGFRQAQHFNVRMQLRE